MSAVAARVASGRRRAPAPLFADGFRPFFLLAAIDAALSLVLWVASFSGLAELPASWPGVLWHGHEMLWGFAAAGLAGFLLTAVPHWTAVPPVRGTTLGFLVAVWALGRIAFWWAAALPPALLLIADLAFIPLLVATLACRLVAQRPTSPARLVILFGIVALFWSGDLLTHLGAMGRVAAGGTIGPRLGIDALLLAITMIGGRIIPAFTGNTLRRRGNPQLLPRSLPALEAAAVLSMACLTAVHALLPTSPIIGVLALAAAAAQGARLALWRPLATLAEPLLAVLHLGYAWLVLGLALEGAASLSQGTLLPGSAALHAETAGAIGTMLMAVMSRAALGHTGRPLHATPPVVVAYALLSAAALLRVLAPLTGAAALCLLALSGMVWACAWAIFAGVYAPILARPRLESAAA